MNHRFLLLFYLVHLKRFFRVKSRYCSNDCIGVFLLDDKKMTGAFCRSLQVVRSF